jgi:hypothetical protein
MHRTRLLFVGLAVASQVTCANVSTSPTATRPVAVAKLTPDSGPVGTAVVVTGSNFAAARNHVQFGIGYVANLASADGTTLRFSVPVNVNVCPPDSTDPCAMVIARVLPGDYPVAVITGGETSNTLHFTVTTK